jgi:molybdenum cofactor cytidylyltransferase
MSLPVVDPPRLADADRDETDTANVAAVVLAAGRGSRYDGGNKLLASVDGASVVRCAVETVLESRVETTTVVLGYQRERVRDELDGLPIEFITNARYDEGQATSVSAGIAAVSADADAVLVFLGDMPFVSPESTDDLLAAYWSGQGDALAAAFEGQRGNPVIFDRAYFESLTEIDGDVGGRGILRSEGVLVETGDPGVVHDVDTPADLDPPFR